VGPLNDGSYVELAVATRLAIRASVSYSGNAFQGGINSHMVPGPDVPDLPLYSLLVEGDYAGLEVKGLGSALVASNGAFVLRAPVGDKRGSLLVSDRFFKPLPATTTSAPKNVPIGDASVSPFANITAVQFQFIDGANTRYYGSGADYDDAWLLHRTSGNSYVKNRGFGVPYYWSSAGYGVLAVSPSEFVTDHHVRYPARWEACEDGEFNIGGKADRCMRWYVGDDVYPTPAPRRQADLYFTFPARASDSLRALYSLTGAPKVAPLYAHGFLASRWGWTNPAYIEAVLDNFRMGMYPLDAIIMDFEWYTPVTDYDFPVEGRRDFVDFGYNNVTLPKPPQQLKKFHEDYNVRFGGIRKPRIGNTFLLTELRNKGWLLPGSRELNFTLPEVRSWYAQQMRKFIEDGVDFWWNDEGETQYFTFQRWNEAELELLRSHSDTSRRRLFTISRSYTPGVQALGATVIWTGDISESWDDLAKTPGYVLNWHMAGAYYITCDIGGFEGSGPTDASPELVTRWYQVGVMLPIMRVHSRIDRQPHFPFLYPTEYAQAMRSALNLRYRLLPTIYSLIHQTVASGELLIRPLYAEFPHDKTVQEMTAEWMFGPSLLVAPVLSEGGGPKHVVHFPDSGGDTWYDFNSAKSYLPTTILDYPTAIDQLPLFVRSGSIILLAPKDVTATAKLPGGPLEVQIYDHSSLRYDLPEVTFTLVEDDGQTTNYEIDSPTYPTVRRTLFTWNTTSRVLRWNVVSSPTKVESHWFIKLTVTVFRTNGQTTTTPEFTIGPSGQIAF